MSRNMAAHGKETFCLVGASRTRKGVEEREREMCETEQRGLEEDQRVIK